MKYILLIVLIGCLEFSCAQELTIEQLKSREIAEEVATKYFGENFKQKKIGLFSSGDKRFVMLEKRGDNTYYKLNAEYSNGIINIVEDTLYNESTSLTLKIFDTSNYNSEFVSFTSDLYKDGYDISRGDFSYFVLFYEGKRYGELRLSVFVKPVPFDADIYYYFVESLFTN